MAIANQNINRFRLEQYLQTPKQKSYFVAATTLTFFILMFMLGILPAYSAFTQQAEENGRREDAINQLRTKKAILEGLVQEESNKQQIIDKFEYVFTNQPPQVAIWEEINTIAEDTDVYFQSLTFSERDTNTEVMKNFLVDSNVQNQTFTLGMEGSQDKFVNFITQLENQLRIYNVKSMVITKKADRELFESPPGREYKLNLQVEIYYYNQLAATQTFDPNVLILQ